MRSACVLLAELAVTFRLVGNWAGTLRLRSFAGAKRNGPWYLDGGKRALLLDAIDCVLQPHVSESG